MATISSSYLNSDKYFVDFASRSPLNSLTLISKGDQGNHRSGIYQGVVDVGLHRIVREAFTVYDFLIPSFSQFCNGIRSISVLIVLTGTQ